MSRTLLVVDDSATIREAVHHALAGEDWSIVNAEDVAGALSALSDRQPDAVLCDVSLRDVDGYEACRKFREAPGGTSVPLILMGAAVNDTAAMAAGVSSILGKPFASHELMEVLDAAVDQGSFGFDADGFTLDDGEPLTLEPAPAPAGLTPTEEGTEEVEIIDLSEDEGFADLELLEDLEPIAVEPETGDSQPEHAEILAAEPAPAEEPAAADAGGFPSSLDLDLGAAPGAEGALAEPEAPSLEPAMDLELGPAAEAEGATEGLDREPSSIDLGLSAEEGARAGPGLELTPLELDAGEPAATEGTEGIHWEDVLAPVAEAADAEPAAPTGAPSESGSFVAAEEEAEEEGWWPEDEEEAAAPLPTAEEGLPPAEHPEVPAAPAPERAFETLVSELEGVAVSAEPSGVEGETDDGETMAGLQRMGTFEPPASELEEVAPSAEPLGGEGATGDGETQEGFQLLGAFETPVSELGEVAPSAEPLSGGGATDESTLDLSVETPSDYELPWGQEAASEPEVVGEPADAGTLPAAELSATAERAVRDALAASLSAEALAPVVEAVVERVVWEVVPQLAERLIRETIERLKEPPPPT